jgi:hypothetical protein
LSNDARSNYSFDDRVEQYLLEMGLQYVRDELGIHVNDKFFDHTRLPSDAHVCEGMQKSGWVCVLQTGDSMCPRPTCQVSVFERGH